MKKIYEYIFGAIIVLHLIGWGISSYFFSWEFQNNNNVAKSFLFSDTIGHIKGFFWEYYVIKKIINKNKELSQNDIERLKSILKTAMQNNDADLTNLKDEFWKILSKKYGNNKDAAKKEFIGYFDDDYLKYGKEFWLTTLYSYENKHIFISNEVKRLEAILLAKGAFTKEQINKNNKLLYDIVNGNEVNYNGTKIIFTKEMIVASLENADGAIKRFLYIID